MVSRTAGFQSSEYAAFDGSPFIAVLIWSMCLMVWIFFLFLKGSYNSSSTFHFAVDSAYMPCHAAHACALCAGTFFCLLDAIPGVLPCATDMLSLRLIFIQISLQFNITFMLIYYIRNPFVHFKFGLITINMLLFSDSWSIFGTNTALLIIVQM